MDEKNDENKYLISEHKKLNELVEEKQMLIANQGGNGGNKNFKDDKELIKELTQQLEELNLKLSRYPYDLSEGEELISVIVISTDKKIYQSIVCKSTEKFSKLEDILYKEHPEIIDPNNYFSVNGKEINRLKTLKENNIHNSEIIVLNKKEF